MGRGWVLPPPFPPPKGYDPAANAQKVLDEALGTAREVVPLNVEV
jgi:hypothetical protein